MTLSQKLHDDPVVRALLWCLISDDDLSEQSLVESGLSAVEAAALIRDEERLLKRMCVRATVAERVDVKTLAMVLRNRLLEHLEMAEKAAELSSIIRSVSSCSKCPCSMLRTPASSACCAALSVKTWTAT